MTQYWIVANRNCKTHKIGTVLVMTGPRKGLTKGWSILGKAYEAQYACNLSSTLGVI